MRFNGLLQRNEGWRDGTYEDRDGWHLATSYKVGNNTQIRAEHESLKWNSLIFQTAYSDNVSFWDRATVNTRDHPLAQLDRGRGQPRRRAIRRQSLLRLRPRHPLRRVQDYRWAYRSRGTGFNIKPEGRADIAQFPACPRASSTSAPMTPTKSAALNYHAFTSTSASRRTGSPSSAYSAWITTREAVTPRAAARPITSMSTNSSPTASETPNFGVPFADVDQNIQYQDNRVEDFRLLTTYKFELPKFLDLKAALQRHRRLPARAF